jgi:hypothetical protein
LIVILIVKALIIGLIVNWVFNGDIDEFMFDMRTKPIKLAFYFLAAYIMGSVFLFPVSVLVTAMAYSFTHIMGPL